MLQDIKSGCVPFDLLLVDTAERFSRADDAAEQCRKLLRNGVLMLTADTQFADPTTGSGNLYSMVESWRATEDNRIKSHNVLRGKRDSVRRKQWPGGKPPLGYQLQPVIGERKGVQMVDHCVLIPDPSTVWIIQLMFQLADERGWGATRISSHLNTRDDIPVSLKPIHPSTVAHRLDNRIYIGELVWEKHCADIIDDVHVLQRNPEVEWLRIPDFCQPIIDRSRFDRVQAVRQVRSERARKANPSLHDIKSTCGRGLALNYPLSGLVVCGSCRRAMTMSSTKPYVTMTGESKTYPAYVCPGWMGKHCINSRRVSEPWLRSTVVSLIRMRLFGEAANNAELPLTAAGIADNLWYRKLIELVQQESDQIIASRPDQRRQRQARIEDIENQQRGWRESLARSGLNSELRRALEEDYAEAQKELDALNSEDRQCEMKLNEARRMVDPAQVAEAMNQLASVLSGANASAANLVLAQHIDAIECHKDGHVLVRSCRLGALALNGDQIAKHAVTNMQRPDGDHEQVFMAEPRRRTRRRVDCDIANDEQLQAMNQFATDPHRFKGLAPEWFCEDEFQIPRKMCWAESNAIEVARYRLDHQVTIEKTAKKFGKSPPTIKKAIKFAKALGVDATGTAIRLPRKPNWAVENAAAVAAYVQGNCATMKVAAAYFGKSEPTISKALRAARTAQA